MLIDSVPPARMQLAAPDEMRSAAIVLLRGVRGIEAAALIGADRLVLDAVIGGEITVAKGGGRGQ